jgi:hypothetical protein
LTPVVYFGGVHVCAGQDRNAAADLPEAAKADDAEGGASLL